MKAMDKDRNRRYSAADDLAADVGCFLAGETVSACPPSSFYVLSKFVRRNKTVLATSTLVGLAALFGLLGVAYQTVRASRAEARANTEAFEFLIENVLGAGGSRSSADYSPDPNLKLMILLKNAKDSVDERFADEPELKARMKATLASLFDKVGQYDDASGLYNEYYDYLKSTRGHADVDTLRAMRSLVNNLIRNSRFDEASELCDEALRYSKLFYGVTHELTLMLLEDQAMLFHKQGLHEQSVEAFQEVLTIQRDLLGESHLSTLATKSSLATVYEALEKFDEAQQLHEDVLSNYQTQLSNRDPRLAAAQQKFGAWLLASGRRTDSVSAFVQATEHLKESVATCLLNRGPDHPDTLDANFALAQAYLELGELEEALPLLESLHRQLETLRDLDDRMVLQTKNLLGWAYLHQSQYFEAEYILSDAYEKLRTSQPSDELTIQVRENLAITKFKMGKTEDAIALDEQTFRMSPGVIAPGQPSIVAAQARLCLAYQQLGNREKAEAMLERLANAKNLSPLVTDEFLQSLHTVTPSSQPSAIELE